MLLRGLRGHWVLEPEFTRVRPALEYAFLPTAVLVRGRNFTRDFDAVEPPWKLPRRKSQVAVLAVLISLHHFPFLAALEQAYHVELPWAVQLPSGQVPAESRADTGHDLFHSDAGGASPFYSSLTIWG